MPEQRAFHAHKYIYAMCTMYMWKCLFYIYAQKVDTHSISIYIPIYLYGLMYIM